MKDVFDYEAYKFQNGAVTKVTDSLTVESPLQININGKSFTVVMQTPGSEIELTTGLLYNENVIKNFSQIDIKTTQNKNGIIDLVELKTAEKNLDIGYLSSRSLLSVSSCGICGKKEIKDLKPSNLTSLNEASFSFTDLFKIHTKMNSVQSNFSKTGGCHGVAIFDRHSNLLSIQEDIGRHNALDKAIGELIINKKLKQAVAIAFSGRISYEIVSKAFRAKIPIIAAISSPSSLAIDFAKEYGMTLVGFCRSPKATCYAGPNRITNLQL